MVQSVYRIVGVHYNDLLDFLHAKGLRHGASRAVGGEGVKGYLKYVAGNSDDLIPHQIEMMMKVANTVWSVNNLRENAKLFWASYRKNNNALRSIIIMMTVFIGCFITYLLFANELPKLDKLDASGQAKIKVILIHLIIYLIVLAVLLVMEKNFHEKTKEGKSMIEDIGVDFAKFEAEILGLPTEISKALLIMLYDARQSNEFKRRYYRSLKSDITSNKQDKNTNPKLTEKVFTEDSFNSIFTYNSKEKIVSVDRLQLYRTIQAKLNGALLSFYDGGNGYLKMKKVIVSSNTIMMIREMKLSLNYYYSLIQAAIPELEDDDIAEEKKRQIIDKTVVAELKKLNLVSNPNIGEDLSDAEKTTLIQENTSDDAIEAQLLILVTHICYFAFFCYPLYLGKAPLDASFPIIDFEPKMPHNQKLSVMVYQDIIDTYKTVYTKHYTNYMTKMKATTETTDKILIIADMFNTHFKAIFKRIFIEVSYALKGGYLFIFDEVQMQSIFRQSFAGLAPFASIQDYNFTETMIPIVSNTIINELWQEYRNEMKTNTQLETIKADIVSDVSTALVKTQIKDIARYKPYIFERLASPSQTSTYSELISKIDKELQLKRVTNSGDIFASESSKRFITEDDFVAKIDKVSFRDLYNGFNSDYLLDIVKGFYVKISENTQNKRRTLKDIYYTQEKTLQQVKILLILLGHILVAVGVYYTIVLYEERERVKSEQERDITSLEKQSSTDPSDPRLYLAYKRQRNYEAMYWMKLGALYVSLFFFLMLMISFYKKARAKFDFNRETIEANTAELKSAIDALNTQMQYLRNQVVSTGGQNAKLNTLVGKLTEISKSDKLSMFKKVITIVDKFEKCNYINVASKVQLPFPYTEITMDMFMLIVTIMTLFYITARIKPLERIRKIKDLRRQRERTLMGEQDKELLAELNEYYNCHISDMDSLMFAIRIVVFLAIIMFMMFYSSLVISSSNQFKAGLYNSLYFEQGRCYDN
jgi:hypothetical protein